MALCYTCSCGVEIFRTASGLVVLVFRKKVSYRLASISNVKRHKVELAGKVLGAEELDVRKWKP